MNTSQVFFKEPLAREPQTEDLAERWKKELDCKEEEHTKLTMVGRLAVLQAKRLEVTLPRPPKSATS